MFFVLWGSACFSQKCLRCKTVNALDFYTLINTYENEIIIDTRGQGAYKNRHIPGAINITGMKELNLFCDTTDIDTPLLVYCDVGTRSKYVCKQLVKREFNYVYNLKGGIVKWNKDEYPVEEK